MRQRNPRPFVVFADGKFRVVLHAYSRAQAIALAGELIPGEFDVFPVRKGSPLYHDIYR